LKQQREKEKKKAMVMSSEAAGSRWKLHPDGQAATALPPQLGGGGGGGGHMLGVSPRASSPLQAVYNPLLSPSLTPRARVRQATSVR